MRLRCSRNAKRVRRYLSHLFRPNDSSFTVYHWSDDSGDVRCSVALITNRHSTDVDASLLCIFARLAHVDANALVSLLASREIQPSPENEQSKTQLEFVLKKWCEGQPDVHGRFGERTTTALGSS